LTKRVSNQTMSPDTMATKKLNQEG
jgi:hypothetical protein